MPADDRRFAVPLEQLEQLDGVRVSADEQVQEQPQVRHPSDAATWGGLLPPLVYGGSGGQGDDGDGDGD